MIIFIINKNKIFVENILYIYICKYLFIIIPRHKVYNLILLI